MIPVDGLVKYSIVLFLMGVLALIGVVACVGSLFHNERNNIHGYWLLVRAEGDWVVDDEREPDLPERLSIDLDTIRVSAGEPVPFWVPVASGSVSWSDGSCPVTLQFGTPNNPGIPDLWIEPSGAWVNSPFPWNLRERGFAVSMDIASGDPPRHPQETDADRDRLFVVFDDHVVPVGENRVLNETCYVRDAP